MINSLIFSLDRAQQLNLLLESIDKNAKNTFNVNVLYKYSNDEFKKGYDILINKFKKINWIKEQDFKPQVMNFLSEKHDLCCFFTDDDIIYNNVSEKDITQVMENEDVFCFSLRLGKNISYCYTMNASNVLKPEKEEQNIVYWNWTKHYLDFGYPLSVDGHIFRTKDIKKMVRVVQATNPNTLEGNLQVFEYYPKELMAAYETSKLVNSPNNIVNKTHPNRKGEKYMYSTKELNEKFLNKEKIDIDALDLSEITGCHQELELKFKKYK